MFKKSDNKTDCQVFKMHKDGHISFMHTIPKKQITNKSDIINIESDPESSALVEKILSHSTTIADEMKVFNGVKPFAKGRGTPPQTAEIVKTHPYVREGDKPGDGWLPLMRGSLIQRYKNLWNNNYWIMYGEMLAEPRDPRIFQAPEKINSPSDWRFYYCNGNWCKHYLQK